MWIAAGHTDMRRGMQGLALQVEEQVKTPFRVAAIVVSRGRRGDLAKILSARRPRAVALRQAARPGKFIWPSAKEGVISISAAQMAYMLEGIDWRESAADVAAQKRW